MRKAHQIRPKIQVIVFLLTCDTRVLVYTRFLGSHHQFEREQNIEERKKQSSSAPVFHCTSPEIDQSPEIELLDRPHFWTAATNIEERTEHRREKGAAIHQLPVFTAAAQKSINPQRLNRWIVPIFGQQLHSIWANILDG